MLANSSIARTPTGSTELPTHLIGGKEHEGYVPAQQSGQLIGAQSLYVMSIQANAALDQLFTLFNISGSGKVVRLKAISIRKGFTALVGAAMQLDLRQVTSPANDGTLFTPVRLDSNTEAKHANIQFVQGDTVASTTFGSTYCSRFYHNEETNEAASIQECATTFWPLAMSPDMFATYQDIVIRENEGIALHCRTAVAAGATYHWNFFYTQADV